MSTKSRIKISACYNSFEGEILKLERFENSNQLKFNRRELNHQQIELMVESIFFAGYRNFEGFIREIFLLYCLEKETATKKNINSYLKPKNFEHSEMLLKSSLPFLDWASPSSIITRSELYLKDGYPIKLPFTTNLQQLQNYRVLRNHIAHNSIESYTQYVKIVSQYYNGVKPLNIPPPGKYLMLPSKKNRNKYLLLEFFALLKKIAVELT